MGEMVQGFWQAVQMIARLDPDLLEIVGLSLRVSFTAVLLAALTGLPIGAALALYPFRGRAAVVVLFNALMGLPPVVVGLAVYLTLSRSGPLGFLGLLFTTPAMILAQWVLVTPIVAAISRQILADLWREYQDLLRSLNARPWQAVLTVIWDGRVSLSTALLAGFGRAIAEVGAVIIVGGNIAHFTRLMTTAIALETSKGDLALAMGLGLILITLSLTVNAGAYLLQSFTREAHG
ncbi:MAG TPA: ABC transporter permease [bacterium]